MYGTIHDAVTYVTAVGRLRQLLACVQAAFLLCFMYTCKSGLKLNPGSLGICTLDLLRTCCSTDATVSAHAS